MPLVCFSGEDCRSDAGSFTLAGGFDLVFGDRRASVANLALATSGSVTQGQGQTITGTLDGAQATIASGYGSLELTDEFTQRAGDALGTDVFGSLTAKASFTQIGP